MANGITRSIQPINTSCKCYLFTLAKAGPGWQVTESVGGWHAVAEDSFKLAPSACIPALTVMLYLKPPFTLDLWYEITLSSSGAPVQMFQRKTPQVEIEQAYRDFMISDRGEQAGFKLAQRIFGIGDEQNVKNAEE